MILFIGRKYKSNILQCKREKLNIANKMVRSLK